MKLGLSSLLFPRISIEEMIKLSAKLGVESVEIIFDIPHFPPQFDMKKLKGLRKLMSSYGLEVAVHASIWDINPASHHRQVRKLALARVKKSIDACHSLGGEVVVVHPGHCPIREVKELLNGARDRYREFVEECWKHARGKGVTLHGREYRQGRLPIFDGR
jgi:sugar phosphate isomerase/epimerase